MKHMLIFPLLLTFALWEHSISDLQIAPTAGDTPKSAEVTKLRQEISTLNLVNGLYLTEAQIKQLLPILYQARDLQKEYGEKLEEQSAECKAAFTTLRAELVANKGIAPETEKRAHRANEAEKALKEEYQTKMIALESQVKSILTDNQLCIIDDFKPCLIPPKNLRDPARVGQARGDASGAQAFLERTRHIPERRFEKMKDTFLEKYFDKLEREYGLMTDEEKEQERQRVLGIVERARNLSDVDFEMKKAELAKQLTPQSPEHRLRKYELGKVGKFLLNTSLIPVLESRLVESK